MRHVDKSARTLGIGAAALIALASVVVLIWALGFRGNGASEAQQPVSALSGPFSQTGPLELDTLQESATVTALTTSPGAVFDVLAAPFSGPFTQTAPLELDILQGEIAPAALTAPASALIDITAAAFSELQPTGPAQLDILQEETAAAALTAPASALTTITAAAFSDLRPSGPLQLGSVQDTATVGAQTVPASAIARFVGPKSGSIQQGAPSAWLGRFCTALTRAACPPKAQRRFPARKAKHIVLFYAGAPSGTKARIVLADWTSKKPVGATPEVTLNQANGAVGWCCLKNAPPMTIALIASFDGQPHPKIPAYIIKLT